MEESGPKVSKYNSAITQLLRINELWIKTHKSATDISYARLNEFLDRVWVELEDDATKDIRDEMKKVNDKINELAIYGLSNKLKKKNPALYFKIIKMQKNYLMEKELIIRRLQNKAGKGTAYEDSVEDYMDDF